MSDPSQPSNDPGLGAGGGSGGGNAQNGGGPGSSSGADNKNSGTNSSSNNNNNNSNGNNNNNNNNAVGVERFITYEDYLDSQITAEDRKFLSDDELARSLVEIGCRKEEVLSREEFSTRRDAAEALKKSKLQNAPKILSSAQKDLTNYPFLRHLAAREELVRHGKLSVIIFIRDRNSKGQEVSGYIDYAHRLRTENFEPYFLRKKKLLPTTRDLSYMNWDTSQCTQNESPEFHILPDFESGLLFKNKKDRKIICVDPRSKEAGDNSKRHEIQTNEYIQVVLFDHMTRKKS